MVSHKSFVTVNRKSAQSDLHFALFFLFTFFMSCFINESFFSLLKNFFSDSFDLVSHSFIALPATGFRRDAKDDAALFRPFAKHFHVDMKAHPLVFKISLIAEFFKVVRWKERKACNVNIEAFN